MLNLKEQNLKSILIIILLIPRQQSSIEQETHATAHKTKQFRNRRDGGFYEYV